MKYRAGVTGAAILLCLCLSTTLHAKTAICYQASGNDHWFIVNANIDCNTLVSTPSATVTDCWNFLQGPHPPTDPNVTFVDPNSTEFTPANPTLVITSRLGTGAANTGTVHLTFDQIDVTSSSTITPSSGGIIVSYPVQSNFMCRPSNTASISYQDNRMPPGSITATWTLLTAQPSHNVPAVSDIGLLVLVGTTAMAALFILARRL